MLIIRLSILLFLSVLLNATQVEASRIKKGNEALIAHDYFKAKKLFMKGLKYNVSAASFGLATIYSRNNNPFFNLDSAYQYVRLANSTWNTAKLRKKEKWKIYKWTKFGIDSLSRLISSQFYTIAKERHTVEGYTIFLNKNPNSLEFNNALHVRDSIAFFNAVSINNVMSYSNFMEDYPKSEYYQLAEENFQNSRFQEHTVNRSLESFVSFVEQFPNSPMREEADRAIFQLVTVNNTVEAYAIFTKNYPENTFIDLGWSRFYQLFISNYSSNRIQEFKENYQNASNQNEIYSDLALIDVLYFPFLKDNKMGLMNDSGVEMIKADYDFVGGFHQGLALFTKGEKVGLINKRGDKQIKAKYDGITPIDNGRFIVENNDLLGLIDRNGTELLACKYENVLRLSRQNLFITLKDSNAIVDYNGNLLTETQYEEVEPFDNHLAIVVTANGFGVIDTNFNFLLKDKFVNLNALNDSLFSFESNDFLGIVNLNGDTILQPHYSYIGAFKEGLALVSNADTINYITTKGEIGINRFFQTYSNYKVNGDFLNGIAIVYVGEEFGRVNKEGVFITRPDYENISRSEKLVPFQTSGLWGAMNQKNELIIPSKYQSLDVLSDKYVLTKLDYVYGVVDVFGNNVIENTFKSIIHLQGDSFVVSDDSQFGLFLNGQQVTTMEYSVIRNFKDGFVSLVNNDGISYFDLEKKRIIKLNKD